MAKITYSSLKLKIDDSVEKVKWNDFEIEVLQYLPIKEKYQLVAEIVESLDEYNPILIDSLFHLNLVYYYAKNLTFTEKQKEEPLKIYDNLNCQGILALVVSAIPEEEYNFLFNAMNEMIVNKKEYKNSFIGTLSSIADTINPQLNKLQDFLQNADLSQFQNVLDFAKAANGGRDI